MRAVPLLGILLVLTALATTSLPSARAEDDANVLRVGQLGEMKTRNPLAAVAEDVWTHDVLDRVYDRPVKERDGRLLPYIAKGVDADEDGTFEPATEYDRWLERANPTSPLDVTVYYDFNGVRWHDGTQMTVWDLFFSYHVTAMNPRWNAKVRALFRGGSNASYEAGDRQLGVAFAPGTWESEPALGGDPGLRAAVRFTLDGPYARFANRTLAVTLLPLHVWSGTGGDRHRDFGCAIWIPRADATARGVPACGTDDAKRWGTGIAPGESVPGSSPFAFGDAEAWTPRDADVIGSGPFRFESWEPGTEASVSRNDDYYIGSSTDGRLRASLRLPRIDGIEFYPYDDPAEGVWALLRGEVDVLRWNVDDYAGYFWNPSDVGLSIGTDPGFVYLGYNGRKSPWDDADAGSLLRRAISHLIDKRSLARCYWEWCVSGGSVVNPANLRWYNDDIPKPAYDVAQATALLDSPAARALGIGPDNPGPCGPTTPDGCRTLPRLGNASFEILAAPGVDPRQRWAAPFVANSFRSVGLNAGWNLSRRDAFASIATGAFDLFVLDLRPAESDPDFLYDFLHSSNARAGPNYAGTANATLDAELDASRRAPNYESRREHVFRVQRLVAQSRPLEVLYYPRNVEAYRADRFVNWTEAWGTIWNEWSLFGIRPPVRPAAPRVALQLPAAMRSNEREGVRVTVRDAQWQPLRDASVALSADRGELTLGETTGPSVSGITDSRGEIAAWFTAPAAQELATVVITANVTHEGYREPGVVRQVVLVFPPERHSLSLTLELPQGDIARPGEALPLAITVRDERGLPVLDAYVTIVSSNPAHVRASRENGGAGEVATVLLRVNETVDEASSVRIVVHASKPGFRDAEGTTTVTVLTPARPEDSCSLGANRPECAGEVPAGGLSAKLVAAIGLVMAATVMVWFLGNRRRPAR